MAHVVGSVDLDAMVLAIRTLAELTGIQDDPIAALFLAEGDLTRGPPHKKMTLWEYKLKVRPQGKLSLAQLSPSLFFFNFSFISKVTFKKYVVNIKSEH